MISRSIFEAFDRTFKDIFGKANAALETVPFGSRLLVFGEDFRQVLPIIPRGSRSDIVSLLAYVLTDPFFGVMLK
jgi:ATP-dependent DNA helicase PIF1